jgi:hypothetical protein
MNEATSALVKIALELHKVERLEIHCDVENIKSAAVPSIKPFPLFIAIHIISDGCNEI